MLSSFSSPRHPLHIFRYKQGFVPVALQNNTPLKWTERVQLSQPRIQGRSDARCPASGTCSGLVVALYICLPPSTYPHISRSLQCLFSDEPCAHRRGD
ncbi:hypothetical protein BDN70DRAFT_236374 [Pholiota conissans]|uniref:Uncharacterized protein n=1 Tax=Pholiota conissans TaxID=109636 RepID=A0A9P5ZHV0_9AGAR|nr:hypothetical protein BDN70DRAFT_236374 [Pholiota conissans]